jgi:hypothetical protein
MTKKATNRRIRADELFVIGLSKMCPDLRRQVLEGKIKLQKTQIKKLGKCSEIKNSSIHSIAQVLKIINL